MSSYFTVKQVMTKLLGVLSPEDHELRAEVVMILWSRILDEECIITTLIPSLDETTRAKLRHQLGPLYLFNPLEPNAEYMLNFSMRDERLLAKFILGLATTEYPPVDSGVGLQPAGTFDELKEDAKGPVELKKVPEGWLLQEPEGGLPHMGIWSVNYSPPLVEVCVSRIQSNPSRPQSQP